MGSLPSDVPTVHSYTYSAIPVYALCVAEFRFPGNPDARILSHVIPEHIGGDMVSTWYTKP